MSGVNKVILVGRLGIDPETYTFDNGNKKVSFRMATGEVFKNKEGQRIEHTEWHNIVTYHKLAEIAGEYLKKGMMLYVEGRIRSRTWEDAGVKKYFSEIEAQTFTILSSKKDDAASSADNSNTDKLEDSAVFDPQADDLPF